MISVAVRIPAAPEPQITQVADLSNYIVCVSCSLNAARASGASHKGFSALSPAARRSSADIPALILR